MDPGSVSASASRGQGCRVSSGVAERGGKWL